MPATDRLAAPLLAVLAAACAPAAEPAVTAFGSCGTLLEAPFQVSGHVEPGTPLDYATNPPTSGTHFAVWAAWGRHHDDEPLDRGYWLHNLEHGGVAFLYHCPEGCADEIAALEELVRGLPADPHCAPPLRTRTLLTADPLLPDGVRFAAVAWGFAYTASCLDLASLRAFYDEHVGMAAENFCAEGLELGGTPTYAAEPY